MLPLFPDEGVAAALARRSRLRVSARSLLAAMRWRICGESIGEDVLPPALTPLPPECDEMGGTEDAEEGEDDEEDEKDEDTEDDNCCACMCGCICGRNMSPSMFWCWFGERKDERNEEGRRGGDDMAGVAEVEEEDDEEEEEDDDDDDDDDDGDDEHERRDCFLCRSSRRISWTASRTLRLSARLALESRLFPICFQIRSK